jgi:hypothetical protein
MGSIKKVLRRVIIRCGFRGQIGADGNPPKMLRIE